MMSRSIRLLVLGLVCIPIAIFSFKSFESRLVAGMVAGFFFLIFGFFGIYQNWKSKLFYKLPSTYLFGLHLFLISIPMVGTRLLNWNRSFSEIKILGLSGPSFHKLSEIIFLSLLICLTIEIIYFFRSHRKSF